MRRSREETFAALVGGVLPRSSLKRKVFETFLDDPDALLDQLPDSIKHEGPQFLHVVRKAFQSLGTEPFDRAVVIPLVKPLLETAITNCRSREDAQEDTKPIWCVQSTGLMVESPVKSGPRPGEIALNVCQRDGRLVLEAVGQQLDIGADWLPGDQYALEVGPSMLLPIVNRATFRCGLADFTAGRLHEAEPVAGPKHLVGLIEQNGKGVLVTSSVNQTGTSVEGLRIYEYDPAKRQLSPQSDSAYAVPCLYWLDTLHVRHDEVFAVGHTRHGAELFLLYGPVVPQR